MSSYYLLMANLVVMLYGTAVVGTLLIVINKYDGVNICHHKINYNQSAAFLPVFNLCSLIMKITHDSEMGFIQFDSLTCSSSNRRLYVSSGSILFTAGFYMIMFLVHWNADKMLVKKKNLKGRDHLGDLGG